MRKDGTFMMVPTLLVMILTLMVTLALLVSCEDEAVVVEANFAPYTAEETSAEERATEETKRAERHQINREARTVELTETAEPTTTEEETLPERIYLYYTISGDELDRDLQRYIQDEMEIHGIPAECYPLILCQAYQESSFHVNCLTPYPGGNDCGLFQFRDRYFKDYLALAGYPRDTDIMNPYVQIDIFCMLYGRRLRSGQSIEKTISDWMSGGYTDEIIEEYVGDVLHWQARLQQVP